jgi:hypothetical protein
VEGVPQGVEKVLLGVDVVVVYMEKGKSLGELINFI